MSLLIVLALFVNTTLAAETNETNCGVIPMSQWLGHASLRYEPLPSPVSLVVIQHTVYAPCASDDQCESVARSIRTFHMQRKKFTDIGQSFLVGGNGKIYEGAGWGHVHVGAHTLGYNNRSISVSFMGDFRESLPTPEALEAAKSFLSCAVQNKFLTENYQLAGHQQVSRTQIPGGALQKAIQSWPHWVEMGLPLTVQVSPDFT